MTDRTEVHDSNRRRGPIVPTPERRQYRIRSRGDTKNLEYQYFTAKYILPLWMAGHARYSLAKISCYLLLLPVLPEQGFVLRPMYYLEKGSVLRDLHDCPYAKVKSWKSRSRSHVLKRI